MGPIRPLTPPMEESGEEGKAPTTSECLTKLVDFEATYRMPDESNSKARTITTAAVKFIRRFAGKCNAKRTIFKHVPIIPTLITYDVKENLLSDVISGLIVGIIAIPQCMAYAALSTLPHIVGLYLSFFASVTYLVFGTSRQLSWGCVSIISLLTGNLLYKYDHSEEGIAFIRHLNLTYQQPSHFSHNGHVPPSFVVGDNALYHDPSQTTATDAFPNNASNLHPSEGNMADIVTARRIEIACGASLVAGLIVLAASQLGLSRITTIMSNSLITGFTVGIAFHVASSQLDEVFGIPVPMFRGTGHLFMLWYYVIEHLPETNLVVFLLTIISMAVIYVVRTFVNDRYRHRMKIPIPIELLVVITSILVSSFLHLHTEHRVAILGNVPVGVPAPTLPNLYLVTDYIGDAVVIIIVAHAQSLAMAKTLSMEHNYPIDTKQEMLAAGLATFVCGLFSGFTPCASISRSIVQSGSGGKTQITSLVSAGLVLLVIMVIGPYFYHLPSCIMSAIILVSVRGMFVKLLTIPDGWRRSRHDCCVWVFTCVVTIVLDTGVALLVSVGFSLGLVLVRQMINPVVELGQIIQTSDQGDGEVIELRPVDNYYQIRSTKNVRLVKIKHPLYFLNSESFTDALFELTQIDPIYLKSFESGRRSEDKQTEGSPILEGKKDVDKERDDMLVRLGTLTTLCLDLSEVSFIDAMGVQALDFVVYEFDSVGVRVVLCSVSESIFRILKSTGFWDKYENRLFLSVPSAMRHLGNTIDADCSTETQDSLF